MTDTLPDLYPSIEPYETGVLSAWQFSQRTRKNPCSSRPHFRYASNSSRT
jgi:hypothetical protein